MDTAVQTLVNALMQSSFVALMAVGLVLIFGVMRVINFAHGEFYMAGAYVVFWLYAQHQLPFFAAVVAAMIIVGIIGLIMEQILFKPMRDNPLGGLIMSVGVLFILQVLAAVIFGVGLMKHIPPNFPGATQVFMEGVSVPWQRLVAFGISILLLVGLWLFLKRTRLRLGAPRLRAGPRGGGAPGHVDQQAGAAGHGARRRHGRRRRRDHGAAGPRLPLHRRPR